MNFIHGGVLALAIAAGGRACAAQGTSTSLVELPQAPELHEYVLPAEEGSSVHPALEGSPVASPVAGLAVGLVSTLPTAPSPAPSRTVDRKFLLVNGLQLGMTMFDIAMTQNCIASGHCREANPLMPSSFSGQLTVGLTFVAYGSGVSYWLKKHKSRLWWLPPASGVATHAVGVASGFEHQ